MSGPSASRLVILRGLPQGNGGTARPRALMAEALSAVPGTAAASSWAMRFHSASPGVHRTGCPRGRVRRRRRPCPSHGGRCGRGRPTRGVQRRAGRAGGQGGTGAGLAGVPAGSSRPPCSVVHGLLVEAPGKIVGPSPWPTPAGRPSLRRGDRSRGDRVAGRGPVRRCWGRRTPRGGPVRQNLSPDRSCVSLRCPRREGA